MKSMPRAVYVPKICYCKLKQGYGSMDNKKIYGPNKTFSNWTNQKKSQENSICVLIVQYFFKFISCLVHELTDRELVCQKSTTEG